MTLSECQSTLLPPHAAIAATVLPPLEKTVPVTFPLATIASEQIRVADTISTIGREAWNACFPGEIEDYDYLLALEESAIGGFTRRYLVIEEQGLTIAAMPAFFVDYPVDTTIDAGTLRDVIRFVRRVIPRFFILKLASLGGPEIERGFVGFHPSVAPERHLGLLTRLVTRFEQVASENSCGLISAKDVPAEQWELWKAATPHYCSFSGMATARLAIDFPSMDAYFARLSKETRKDMRRKLKAASAIRIEHRTEIQDVLPALIALYRETRERSEFQFEELTEAYFTTILARMAGRAFCTLYYHGDELLAANLLLHDETVLLDKFFCMNGERGRAFNLYFLSWFTNLQYCLDHGLQYYQSGQAGYETKLRLGSTLLANWVRFHHTNRIVNRLLQWIAPLLAMGEESHAQ